MPLFHSFSRHISIKSLCLLVLKLFSNLKGNKGGYDPKTFKLFLNIERKKNIIESFAVVELELRYLKKNVIDRVYINQELKFFVSLSGCLDRPESNICGTRSKS